MSSVKSYEVNGSSSFYEDEKGSFVDYEDYAALETIRVAVSPQWPTPATESFLAEVRAQGVEMLAENHQNVVDALNGDSLFADGERRHAAIAAAAVYYAAQLRKGAAE